MILGNEKGVLNKRKMNKNGERKIRKTIYQRLDTILERDQTQLH